MGDVIAARSTTPSNRCAHAETQTDNAEASCKTEERFDLLAQVEALRGDLDFTRAQLCRAEDEKLQLEIASNYDVVQISPDEACAEIASEKQRLEQLRQDLEECVLNVQRKENQIEELKFRLDIATEDLQATEQALSISIKQLEFEKPNSALLSEERSDNVQSLELHLQHASSSLSEERESTVQANTCVRLSQLECLDHTHDDLLNQISLLEANLRSANDEVRCLTESERSREHSSSVALDEKSALISSLEECLRHSDSAAGEMCERIAKLEAELLVAQTTATAKTGNDSILPAHFGAIRNASVLYSAMTQTDEDNVDAQNYCSTCNKKGRRGSSCERSTDTTDLHLVAPSTIASVESISCGNKLLIEIDDRTRADAMRCLRRFCHLQNDQLLRSLKTYSNFLLVLLSGRLDDARSLRYSAEHISVLRDVRDDVTEAMLELDALEKSFDVKQLQLDSNDSQLLQFDNVLQRLELSEQKLAGCLSTDLQALKDELNYWKREAELRVDANLTNEIGDLEQELLEIQAAHADEIEAMRAVFQQDEHQLQQRLAAEVELRKKCQQDMQQMKKLGDHALETLEQTQEQILKEYEEQHRREIEKLKIGHRQELLEEKEATRHAIDSLRKAHEFELERQLQKARQTNPLSNLDQREMSRESESSMNGCGEMLTSVRKELSHLSVAFSSKCLELSQLEQELCESRDMLNQVCKGVPFDQLAALDKNRIKLRHLDAALKQKESECKHANEQVEKLENSLFCSKEEVSHLRLRCDEMTKQLHRHSSLKANCSTHSTTSSNSANESDLLNNVSSVSCDVDSSEAGSDIAAEYTPKTARHRRLPNSSHLRRLDARFQSSPNLEATIVGQYPPSLPSALTARRSTMPSFESTAPLEIRAAMGLPVSERRKIFESLGM